MAGVLFLNVLDVARAFGANPLIAAPKQVADWLILKSMRPSEAADSTMIRL
jgi:hypothetical protein